MKTTYATMVGNICLDKFTNEDGNPAPVTFTVKEAVNGRHVWQQGTISYFPETDTLEGAIVRLHAEFETQMDESGYRYCENGAQNPFTLGLDTMHDPCEGESGWYTSENWLDGRCDYPADDYPLLASDWIKKQITSYAYDNYSVMIVTSNGDRVY